jgi:glycosyltransferase involved in cell wall biosynthesis
MAVLFAHDHRFHRTPSTVYSSGKFPYRVWSRYLEVFGGVDVVARVTDDTEAHCAGMTPSSGPDVTFRTAPSLSSPVSQFTRRAEAERILEEALAPCEALIARLPSEIGTVAVSVAERMGKPWCAEVVACTWDSFWNHGEPLARVYAPYVTARTRNVIRRAPFAYYVTDEFLQRRYPCSGHSVGCANVEIAGQDEAALARRLAARGSASAPLRVGLIGSLFVNYKGIDTALRALALARNSFPPFSFHLLGEGDPTNWQRMANDLGIGAQTHFEGTLPSGEAVLEWLDRIDLYLQPSRQEGLCRALIEAMSRGCPALASTAGGNPELLEPECLHRPGDFRSLAARLVKAGGYPAWRAAQSQRNFSAAARYTRPVLSKTRSSFWQEFAAYARGEQSAAGRGSHRGAAHTAGGAA